MPKVSIIVPVYNAEKTIRRCMESVLHQTWPDFELLIMDDGSFDRSAQIIDEYAAQDPRIRPVHKENSGVSDTRNQALELAQGEYIQFLDADDWVAPDATRLFVRAMEERPECDMVIADFYRVIDKRMSQKGDIDEERLITREEYAQYMMRNPADFYYGVIWNKFFRRSIIEEYDLRMDENLSWAEDFIFNMEYILHTNMIYVLKVPVYYYVKTEGSLVAQGGMSIAKTVQMKLNVIEYYSKFYKNIYTSGSYYLRSPVIYSFLLNFAKDGAVNPVAPDKRIGESRLNVSFSEEMADNPFVANFYEDRMLEAALDRIMSGNDLEQADALILLYLKLSGGTAPVSQIRSFTGLTGRTLPASIQKLIRRGIIERVRLPREKRSKEKKDAKGKHANRADESLFEEALLDGKLITEEPAEDADEENTPDEKTAKKEKVRRPVLITFGEESQHVRDSIDRAFRDVEELQLRDFTESEKDQYKTLRKKAAYNAYRALYEPSMTQ